MSKLPSRHWWTAREIAEAALPDMPRSQQNVEALAKRKDWRGHPDHARRRKGRGGGWEYSWELFPLRARQKLLRAAAQPDAKRAPDEDERRQRHASFDALPEAAKTKARARLRVLQKVVVLEQSGLTRLLAVDVVAHQEDISSRTIWNWFSMVGLVPREDWLFYLAPRHRTARRTTQKAECSQEFMRLLKGDYLRLERPSFSSAYARVVEICRSRGAGVLNERTARRRMNEEVPRVTQIYAREGEIGLQRCFPPQVRDRTDMVAMEGVNADCHKFDVFVLWPDDQTPSRAQIVAFQDIYSGKILSWRIDRSPNKVAVMAAFGDLVEEYGIPQHCLFDNGREFANKWLTGGAPTRFRFKVREDDPLGVLAQLNIQIHWATPGHGQAKPIERAFRDFADHIAKDPRFAGAYVGHKPDAKPENYGSKAVAIDEFIRVVAQGVDRHNARLGRRTETALGGSFDEAFAKSYASAPIRKATEEHHRLWLMGQEVKTLHRTHGRVGLHKNTYWSAWMNEHAGQKVVLRFDPEDLHAGVYVYALDGSFMGFAACEEKVGFFDLTGAKDHARRKSRIRQTERKLLKHHREMGVGDVAAAMDEIAPADAVRPEAKVVQLAHGARKPPGGKVERPVSHEPNTPEQDAEVLAFRRQFEAGKTTRTDRGGDEDARDRYLRALDVERRSEAGERIGEAEMKWLIGYRQTAEYQGEKLVHESFGDETYLK